MSIMIPTSFLTNVHTPCTDALLPSRPKDPLARASSPGFFPAYCILNTLSSQSPDRTLAIHRLAFSHRSSSSHSSSSPSTTTRGHPYETCRRDTVVGKRSSSYTFARGRHYVMTRSRQRAVAAWGGHGRPIITGRPPLKYVNREIPGSRGSGQRDHF